MLLLIIVSTSSGYARMRRTTRAAYHVPGHRRRCTTDTCSEDPVRRDGKTGSSGQVVISLAVFKIGQNSV
jgi:hypothetical protein